MKLCEQQVYTKQEIELIKAGLIYPKETVPISPHLYKQLKDKISVLERQNFTLAQDNRVLETKIAALEYQLLRANTIIDGLL